MGQLVFQATLGGQVNLVGPNTASTFNINVPAFAGTMASLASVTTNGVTYVNSSGQPTTGSAFVFDGANVGIGTSSPSVRLDVSGSGTVGRFTSSTTDSSVAFVNSNGGTSTYIGNGGTNAFYVSTNGSERMRIDSTGNVGIGTSSPSSILNVKAASPIFRLETTAAVGSGGTAYNAVRDSTGADVFTYGYQGLANCFQFTTIPAAGFMRFLTGAQVEAMRIDSSGNLLVGTTTAVSGSNHIVVGSNAIQGVKKDFTNLSTTNQSFGFQASNCGVYIGNMKSISGASVAFLVSCVFNNSAIDMFTTSLGNCTAGGNTGTITGINGDARIYTFTRNASTGELQVTASSTATGTTTIYLTPLNIFA